MYIEEKITALEKQVTFMAQEIEALRSRKIYLTVKEAAEALSLNEQTVYKKIREGKIRTINIAGAIRVPMDQF